MARRYELTLTYKTSDYLSDYTSTSNADVTIVERKAYTVESTEELDAILSKEPKEITLLGQTLYLTDVSGNGVRHNG